MSQKMSRRAYAEHFGPTVGDRLRLADTALVIEIEKDYAVYGDEVKFGGGKVIRDGMGQSSIPNTASPRKPAAASGTRTTKCAWRGSSGRMGCRPKPISDTERNCP